MVYFLIRKNLITDVAPTVCKSENENVTFYAITPRVKTAELTSYSTVRYLVYEPVGEMEESNHSAPCDPIVKDAPGDSHEEILRTVGLHLPDQSEKNKLTRGYHHDKKWVRHKSSPAPHLWLFQLVTILFFYWSSTVVVWQLVFFSRPSLLIHLFKVKLVFIHRLYL